MKNKKQVALIEFKRLLHDIRDRRPDVHVRIRILGQMWSEYFYEIRSIKNDELILFNNGRHRSARINDVIQFELECSFFGYQAYYHYDITLGRDNSALTTA